MLTACESILSRAPDYASGRADTAIVRPFIDIVAARNANDRAVIDVASGVIGVARLVILNYSRVILNYKNVILNYIAVILNYTRVILNYRLVILNYMRVNGVVSLVI